MCGPAAAASTRSPPRCGPATAEEWSALEKVVALLEAGFFDPAADYTLRVDFRVAVAMA
jgi:hypothetical protein